MTWCNLRQVIFSELVVTWGCGGVCLYYQLLGRLKQENPLNQGGRGCSELRLHHCTPAWPHSDTLSQRRILNLRYNLYSVKCTDLKCTFWWVFTNALPMQPTCFQDTEHFYLEGSVLQSCPTLPSSCWTCWGHWYRTPASPQELLSQACFLPQH